MKKGFVIFWVGLFLVGVLTTGYAKTEPDEAKAFLEKAVSYYKAHGKEKSLKEFSNPNGEFVKGELYIFIWDLNGIVLAHGTNQKLIGKDVSGLKDADGKLFVKEGMDLAKTKGSGWVDYKWTNPVNKKVEAKATYVKKVDDIIFCCGIYK